MANKIMTCLLWMSLVFAVKLDAQDFWTKSGKLLGGKVNTFFTDQSGKIYAGCSTLSTYNQSNPPACLYVSPDNGVTWNELGFSNNYINFITQSPNGNLFVGTGFTSNGKLYKSTDNGTTWTDITNGINISPYGGTSSIVSMLAVSNEIFIVGSFDCTYRTTNSGQTWTKLTYTEYGYVSDYGSMKCIVKTNSGLLANMDTSFGSKLYRSTDNGLTWTKITQGLPDGGVNFIKIYNVNGAIFACADEKYPGGIFKSTDNGLSWNRSNTGFNDTTRVKDIILYNNKLYSLTANGIYTSTNNGGAWTLFNSTNQSIRWTNCLGLNSTKLLLGTEGYGVISTSDLNNLTVLGPEIRYISQVYNNANNKLFASTYSGVYSSTDNAATWQKTNSLPIESECFYPKKNGYLFASYGYSGLYRSLDNGVTWDSCNTGLPRGGSTGFYYVKDIISIIENAAGTLFIGVEGAGIYKSTNNGVSWLPANAGLPQGNYVKMSHIIATSTGKLFAAQQNSELYTSVNDGVSWSQVTDIPLTIWELYVAKDGYIYAKGWDSSNNDLCYFSNNDGTNWNLLVTPGNSNFWWRNLVSNSQNVLFGIAGGVCKSENHGQNWLTLSPTGIISPNTIDCKNIVINQQDYLFLASSNGLFKTNQSTITGIANNQQDVINKLHVSNYPNPFNPETEINYTVPSTSLVKLAVYNTKGELVKELINSSMPIGNYTIKFDGSQLNSGIYFYKLECNGKSVSNKMMLIK